MTMRKCYKEMVWNKCDKEPSEEGCTDKTWEKIGMIVVNLQQNAETDLLLVDMPMKTFGLDKTHNVRKRKPWKSSLNCL